MISPKLKQAGVACLVVGLAMTTGPMSAAAQGTLSPREQDAVGKAWLDELNIYYASGDPDLVPSTTPRGLEQLREFDWRFDAVESGRTRFAEEWGISESSQWDETHVDGELVRFELRLAIDVERLARTLHGTTGRTIEMSDGVVRRALSAAFVRDTAAGGWTLDAIGQPAGGAYQFSYRELAPVRPCPRLGNPRTARDPFGMEPWCSANGDGKRLLVGPGGQRAQFMPHLSFQSGSGCGWDAAMSLWTGWPPGSPLDFKSLRKNIYVRDPMGQVPGAGRYKRSVRPPKDAISTGVTNGHATIWTSERLGEGAILVRVGKRFERWPSNNAGC